MKQTSRSDRPRRLLLATAVLAATAVLTACASAAGSATVGSTTGSSAPATTASSSGPTPTTAPGTGTSGSPTPVSDTTGTRTPVTTGTTGSVPASTPVPAGCADGSLPDGAPATPKDAPVITVTRGTNAWMLHQDTEPLALAVYRDGTVLTTEGLGSISEPLPKATIGRVPACLVDWALTEFGRVMSLDMGQAMVTDQGTTVVTLARPGQPVRSLSVYALGIGDDNLPDPAQKANRQALLAGFDTVVKAMRQSAPWVPDRLKLITTRAGKNIPEHVWPGPTTLSRLRTTATAGGCMVVTGETARQVAAELGAGPVLAVWTDRGGASAVTGTFVLGILLPSQAGCLR